MSKKKKAGSKYIFASSLITSPCDNAMTRGLSSGAVWFALFDPFACLAEKAGHIVPPT